MKIEKRILNRNEKTVLTAYIPDEQCGMKKRPFIIILPGGGFLDCSPNEGEPVAMYYIRKGFNAAVLTYSTRVSNPGKSMYPQPLTELAESIVWIRRNAEEFITDPERIAVLGFSAGGHVAALYGNTYESAVFETIGTVSERRPDALVLGSPVLSESFYKNDLLDQVDLQAVTGGNEQVQKFREFMNNVCDAFFGKKNPEKEEISRLMPMNTVNKHTPPTFLWQSFQDGLLAASDPLAYAQRLSQNHTICELHMFDEGTHGISLADITTAKKPSNIDTHTAAWADLSAEWLERTFEKRN